MSKNYDKTADGLLFILHNTSGEDKIISQFQGIDIEEFNKKNEAGKSVSIAALEQGQNKIFEYLVSQGIDLTIKNAASYDLLFICAMRGNYDAAKLLLDKYDFKETISATLDYAILKISSNNLDIIKLLITNGAKLSGYYENYLFNQFDDAEFPYNRQELREFYKKYVSENCISSASLPNEVSHNSDNPESIQLIGDDF